MIQITLDPYLLDCLLPDLVGHDRRLSSFIIYLYLYRQASQQANWSVRMSHQSIATGTGLPKRGPERTGTPSESPTYRHLTCAPHRRSTPSRPTALVASQPP